ncbi:uncharacterized protein LOC129776309 [Toxorhynchites rutilus septentrionalis]|uniref:uncharacterized protein LOC129776309 n=1 Tax=Toxorhynchites rutilus septentrionalis TaxID=329112 RepID=UPI00247A62C5|nr:uncharacterized protein LOC129776309 [Toxorhynchites rutilus septentrionalis]
MRFNYDTVVIQLATSRRWQPSMERIIMAKRMQQAIVRLHDGSFYTTRPSLFGTDSEHNKTKNGKQHSMYEHSFGKFARNKITTSLAMRSVRSKRIKFEEENELADFSTMLVELVTKMNPGHCYAFITDPIYDVTLTGTLFREIRNKPRYMLRISEDEDTLMPRPRINCMLEDIHKAGCGAYIILLANGIQMERLLRYGDRTRIIGTRARFLILHDYRLLVPELHYLWKRIVNVVFIKQLTIDDSYSHRSRNQHYELSTVPFPLPLRGIFVSKRLDFWHGGRFRYGKEMFADKTINLDGQIMKVVVLEHPPATFRTAPNGSSNHMKFYGLEVELLKAISYAMKFQMSFYETEDAASEMWGTVLDNDTFTGLLGEMNDGRADFALADLHHTEYHLGIMDLSIPYNTECLTFLTPEALTDNSWETLILPFTGGMWAGVLISLFSIGSVFYALSRALMYVRHDEHYQRNLVMIAKHGKYDKKFKYERFDYMLRTFRKRILCKLLRKSRKAAAAETDLRKLKMLRMVPFKRRAYPWKDPLPPRDIFDTFSGCIIYTYSMLLVVSLPRLPKGWPLRLLTGWYWIYCILLVVAYRASLTAILANPVARLTIDELKDLADSPIRCGAWGEQNKLFFQTAQDRASMTIGKKLEHTPNAEMAVERVVNGYFAYYDNEYALKQLRATRKSTKARETLHIMEECVIHMPISIGMEKNSPLKPKVDQYVRSMVEAGLTKKWLADAIEEFQSNVESLPQEATMNLKKLTAAFIALAIGYGVGLVAFAMEKLYWRCVVEKDKAYDKYI